jgi:hypothetical protein
MPAIRVSPDKWMRFVLILFWAGTRDSQLFAGIAAARLSGRCTNFFARNLESRAPQRRNHDK